MKINENVALAKSILNKSGITSDSDDYKDYLKIREIVGNNNGYVGILTRLRFIDGVEDMDEIQGIFDVLKESNIDMVKLNKMSYSDILDTFYDKLFDSNKKNYELIYKDQTYSYYRVYTYEGILEIGSPAWCIKTKSNWNNYNSKYPEQWVVIDNRYHNKLLNPNSYYLGVQYTNNGKRWVRYGISIRSNDDSTVSYVAYDDNDGECEPKISNYTFYGVFLTVLNLTIGIKKSFYENFRGCKHISDTTLEIVDIQKASDRIPLPKERDNNSKLYLSMSSDYSSSPILLDLFDRGLPYFRVYKNYSEMYCLKVDSKKVIFKLIKDYISEPRNFAYIGMRIKYGLVTKEEVISMDDFLFEVGSWLVFNWNKSYYIAVNTDFKDIVLPLEYGSSEYWNCKDGSPTIFYLIDKEKKSNYVIDISTDESIEILNKLFPKKTKSKGWFW